MLRGLWGLFFASMAEKMAKNAVLVAILAEKMV